MINTATIFHVTEHDSPPITMRALLPRGRAASLIGVRGVSHQQIEGMFHVKLYLHPEHDNIGRLASIHGQPSNLANAWRDALIRMSTIEYVATNTLELTTGVNFLIPTPLAAKIHHGCFNYNDSTPKPADNSILADIMSKSGASLELDINPIPNTTEHILRVSVDSLDFIRLGSFEIAVFMLAECIRDHQYAAMASTNVYYVPHCADMSTYHFRDNLGESNYEDLEFPMLPPPVTSYSTPYSTLGNISTSDTYRHPYSTVDCLDALSSQRTSSLTVSPVSHARPFSQNISLPTSSRNSVSGGSIPSETAERSASPASLSKDTSPKALDNEAQQKVSPHDSPKNTIMCVPSLSESSSSYVSALSTFAEPDSGDTVFAEPDRLRV